MSISDVSITSSMRSTLTSLQNTSKLLERSQTRLSTGKKVNSALDNPVNFFAAQSATQRASDLSSRKDGISEAIQGVLAANAGVTGITSLIESAKGLTQSARSSDRTGRNLLASQFNTIIDQMSSIANDSQYKGKNFLGGDTLQVLFNENGSSFINIAGFDASAAGLGLSAATVGTIDTTTAGQSAGSGSSTATTALHDATLNTTFGGNVIATGFFFNQIAAVALTGSQVSGSNYTGMLAVGPQNLMINVAANPLYMSTGTTFSGLSAAAGNSGYYITAVYANGIAIGTNGQGWVATGGGSGTGTMTFGVNSSAMTFNGLTGQTSLAITYDLVITAHVDNSNVIGASNVFTYNMAGTDIASGAMVDGMVSGATGAAFTGTAAGMEVFIQSGAVAGTGYIAATGTYSFISTGGLNLLVFTGAGAPSTAATTKISYNYNSGYSSFTGPIVAKKTDFTGISLAANQNITNVKIDGASAAHFSLVSGATAGVLNVIQFSGGYEPAAGAKVSYDVITGGTTGTWESDTNISAAIDKLDLALSTLRTSSQTLGSTQNILDIRTNFTDSLAATLLKGADNLTLADMNEEGANLLMLQTRQSLGTSTLKMASDSAQSIMRLF